MWNNYLVSLIRRQAAPQHQNNEEENHTQTAENPITSANLYAIAENWFQQEILNCIPLICQ